MKDEKLKIISDICPFYKEYGTCEQCNTELDIDDEPCYFECMANAIINNGYRKQREGHWFIREYEYFTCSECGGDLWNGCDCTSEAKEMMAKGDIPNFCPNCGAKMKGGE